MSKAEPWFILERGYLPSLRRFVGVLMLFIVPEVYSWSHGGPGPYRVPAWWIGSTPIELPMLPVAVDSLVWFAYATAALALILGDPGRVMPAVGAAVLACTGSSDLLACNSSYTIMIFLFLVALVFDRAPTGCARRLVQVAVTACYGFSALHKAVQTDWSSGQTLAAMVHQGTYFRPIWSPLLAILPRSDVFYQSLALGVVAVEALIAAGLWCARTRRWAVLAAFLLHVSFLVFLNDVDVFAPTMMAGLLAFIGPEAPREEPAAGPSRREVAMAGVVVMALLAMPVRLYILPGGPAGSLSFFDRSPWSFSMYLFVQEVESVSAEYLGPDGHRHSVRLVGRMDRAGSEKELRALAAFVLRSHPEATAVEVRSRLRINHRRRLEQILRIDRDYFRSRRQDRLGWSSRANGCLSESIVSPCCAMCRSEMGPSRPEASAR
jgi:hypothetical protein